MLKIWRFLVKNRFEIRQYSLVLTTILLVTFLFPNRAKFKYEFNPGEVWHYETLEAPFDFPMLKSEEELFEQEQSTRDRAKQYFRRDTSVRKVCLEYFVKTFQKARESQSDHITSSMFSDKHLSTGKEILNDLYRQGILPDAESTVADGEKTLNVLTGNKISSEKPLSLSNANSKVQQQLTASGLSQSSHLYSLISNALKPDIGFDRELTEKFVGEELNAIPKFRGVVRKGENIISQNEIITSTTYQKLISFQEAFNSEIAENKSPSFIFAGYLILTLLVVITFLAYLQFHKKEVFMSTRKLLFMMMWVITYVFLVYAIEKNSTLNSFLIPFCILPIVIKTFYDERLALNTLVAVVLLTSFMTDLGYEFVCLHLIAGIVAVLTNNVTRYWSRFFGSIGLIFLAYVTGYLGLSLIREGSFSNIDWSVYRWLTINAVLTLLAYPLIPLLERIFGFTSSIRLAELADLNRPLLKELSLKAPGTLQHSLQVGNLAEAATEAIGGDTLLVKVAALYHDVGKIENPGYFIENQRGENPHARLTELESAKLIIDHVSKGVALAKKHRIPDVIIDFIRTHHGTTRVEFFYRTHLEKNPGDSGSDHSFKYPGPKPWTIEQSILMLADSIEAASKSIGNPSERNLNLLVDDIVSQKIRNGQLEESGLSFKQLETCRSMFKKVINSIYHGRVEYPDEKIVVHSAAQKN